jgi:putative membrane protein
MRLLLASTHLLALGIGLGSVWARAQALRGPLDSDGLRRVFRADAWWGIAAVLWLATGAARLLGGYEKGVLYYFQNHLFLAKMGLFAAILLLEIRPMAALVRWRVELARGRTPDTRSAGTLATLSVIEAALLVAIVFAAAAMARGLGMPHE